VMNMSNTLRNVPGVDPRGSDAAVPTTTRHWLLDFPPVRKIFLFIYFWNIITMNVAPPRGHAIY